MEEGNKLVTCAGYGGSGSSVITDLLKEFSNVYSAGDFEFTIAHELDGISDLEYYIVNNPHRLNCDQAIYRFKKLINRVSKPYSNYIDEFEKISNTYIDEITQCTWNGHWHNHRQRHSKFMGFIYYNIPNKIKEIRNKFKTSNYEIVIKSRRDIMHYSNCGEEFYELTRKYTSNLVGNLKLDKNEYEYIAMDQLVPPSNIDRYINYFENLKVIIIDRDPRDLYLLNKLHWNEGWIPTDDVDTFIKWFKGSRGDYSELMNNDNCILIKFEDFIYDYENTLTKIMEFLKLDKENHTLKHKYFNPKVSKKNSGLWKQGHYLDDIRLIEKELSQYCYNDRVDIVNE